MDFYDNIPKLFSLLESLKEPPRTGNPKSYHVSAISKIKKAISTNFMDLISPEETSPSSSAAAARNKQNDRLSWKFTCYMHYILTSIITKTNFDSTAAKDLISIPQKNLLFRWVYLISHYHLSTSLPPKMLTNSIISSTLIKNFVPDDERDQQYLEPCLNNFSIILSKREVAFDDSIDYTVIVYLAGVQSRLYQIGQFDAEGTSSTNNVDAEKYKQMLDKLFNLIKRKYFKCLMILKSTTVLPLGFHQQIHQDLLNRLLLPGGFEILCYTVIHQSILAKPELLEKFTVAIENIVCHRGHKPEFHPKIVSQIILFLNKCIETNINQYYMKLCIRLLNVIYNYPDILVVREVIESHFIDGFRKLSEPDDILAGRILLEHQEIMNLINMNFEAFCGEHSIILRSRILIEILPVLMGIHSQIPPGELQGKINRLVIQCLANRERGKRLNEIVDAILFYDMEKMEIKMKKLHPRVVFREQPPNTRRFTCQISDLSDRIYFNSSETFTKILKQSGHNLLIYDVFIHLLEFLEQFIELPLSSMSQSPSKLDYIEIAEISQDTELSDEAKLNKITDELGENFKRRLTIVCTLSDLINYKPFHSQFNENPQEILNCLSILLKKKIIQLELLNKTTEPNGDDKKKELQQKETTMFIVLAVVREFLGKIDKNHRGVEEFIKILQKYQLISQDANITSQIDFILIEMGISKLPTTKSSEIKSTEKIVDGNDEASGTVCDTKQESQRNEGDNKNINEEEIKIEEPEKINDDEQTKAESLFKLAQSMCAENAPHLKVYGIDQLKKLLSNVDKETIANAHAILAIGLDALKSDESYIFLNCVKLFIVLIDVLETEVVETLIAEYQTDESEIDYRLKIGEVLVKITEHLGALSHNYKDELINCFIRGASNKNDEFRTSSLANLGTICRILTYQVHHFFYELMGIIGSIILNDEYVPARRAAVMVLSHLVCGFDRLHDYEAILLPVYRAFKFILENETDRCTRVHATNGLDKLKEKVISLFTENIPIEKEIKILGIKKNDNIDVSIGSTSSAVKISSGGKDSDDDDDNEEGAGGGKRKPLIVEIHNE